MPKESIRKTIDSILSVSVGNLIAFNIIAGSGFLFWGTVHNESLMLKILCGLFLLWCLVTELWFIVSSWIVFFRHKNLFSKALAVRQPPIPIFVRPPLALWWMFQSLLALVWGIILTLFENNLPAYTSILFGGITSAFAYVTFGYFLLVVTTFTKEQEIISKVWSWRNRWAFAHGLIIIATRVFIAPYVQFN